MNDEWVLISSQISIATDKLGGAFPVQEFLLFYVIINLEEKNGLGLLFKKSACLRAKPDPKSNDGGHSFPIDLARRGLVQPHFYPKPR